MFDSHWLHFTSGVISEKRGWKFFTFTLSRKCFASWAQQLPSCSNGWTHLKCGQSSGLRTVFGYTSCCLIHFGCIFLLGQPSLIFFSGQMDLEYKWTRNACSKRPLELFLCLNRSVWICASSALWFRHKPRPGSIWSLAAFFSLSEQISCLDTYSMLGTALCWWRVR